MSITQKRVLLGLFAAAAVLHLHNAWLALPLSGFDGPFHASYAGIVRFEARLPLPDEGVSTFHPPLYYALVAAVWRVLPETWSSHAVLFALRSVGVVAALGTGAAVFASARLLYPARVPVALVSAAVALFLPMLMAPTARVGNEVTATALCAVSVLLLLRCLERPGALGRAAALGAVLGLAVLAKLHALVVVAAAGAVLVWGARGRGSAGLRPAAIMGIVLTLVSGWYFARNFLHTGQPIVMQTELVSEMMKRQGYGPTRPLSAYLSLEPGMILRPDVRDFDAVLPATFATIWFDVHGKALNPKHPWAIVFARVLFLCGAIFTAAALLGVWTALSARAPPAVAWSGPALVLVLTLASVAYIGFTFRVSTWSAIKGTYLSPALLPFCVFVGLGVDLVAQRGVAARRTALALVGVFVAAVFTIFWSGGLAPVQRNTAWFHVRAHADPPTQRVVRIFLRGERGAPPGSPIGEAADAKPAGAGR